MKKIVLASNNKYKIKEIKDILNEYEVLSLDDIGFREKIVESGKTFKENALIKARTVKHCLKDDMLVLADDSGLCCIGLDGKPGVFSARYAMDHNDKMNRDKLIKELIGKNKKAYFECVIVLLENDNLYQIFEGKTFGKIIAEERGNTEFGYDPIFLSDDLGKTFGEATNEEKNSCSHRGRALKKLRKYLEEKNE